MPTPAETLAFFNENLAQVPYMAALGIRALEAGPGTIVTQVPYRPDLVGNPETGVLHGGVITALMDGSCGMAVFLKMPSPKRIATLDLRIDYLKPATPPKAVTVRAECHKLTRQVAFVRATAYHEDPGDPIATAAGTFILFEDRSSPFTQQEGA